MPKELSWRWEKSAEEWWAEQREHRKCVTAKKKTGVGKKPDSSEATTAKIIELFETHPC